MTESGTGVKLGRESELREWAVGSACPTSHKFSFSWGAAVGGGVLRRGFGRRGRERRRLGGGGGGRRRGRWRRALHQGRNGHAPNRGGCVALRGSGGWRLVCGRWP